jgi:hypothetical protein
LVEGDHFGEISYLFKRTVTCTVVTRNYNSMARITHARLRMILSDYPIYHHFLLNKACRYNDPKINLMSDILVNLKMA